MKIINKSTLLLFTIGFLSVLFISCDKDLLEKFLKKNNDGLDSSTVNLKLNMIVIKDCTGSYLRDTSGKFDFHVCNIDKLIGFENGAKVEAYFERLKECTAQDSLIVCKMFHENQGWVEIKDIKK